MSTGPTISERIEAAVEGLLRFIVRFGRTTWTIFRHPLTGIQRVAVADPASRTYVLPLSYLAIGGFAFALVISAFPFGFLNLLDLIWFDDDISRIIYERFQEAFTVTGLLSAAFPVFLCVTICASLARRVLRGPSERHTFTRLNHYAFGYQTFVLFLPMVALIFLDVVVSAINGPYVEPTIDPEGSDALAMILLVVLAVLVVSALLLPALSLSYWRFQFLRTEKSSANALRQIALPLYAFGVFVLVSYAASIPALLAERLSDEPPALEIDIVGDPVFTARVASDGSIEAEARLNVVFYNNPDKALIAEARDVSLYLVREQDGAEPEFWYADDEEVRSSGASLDILIVPASQALVLGVSGVIPLPDEAVDLIKDKAAGKPTSNDYQLYLGVRYSRAGTTLERSLAFDADAAFSSLP
ncbi:MAG: hypothetical protein V2J51_07220 [Erythrobacter sp.]|jgi:hypothetical protein|nr:hypothetical protein [Erythrobacter sp.]